MLKRGGAAVAGALAMTVLAVVPSGTANAVDPTCPFTTGDVHTFDGSDSDSWAGADNWTPAGIPNDNTGDPTPENNTTYVCIPAGETVYLDANELFNAPGSSGWVHLQAYWIGPDATVTVGPGAALFNNNATDPSVIEAGGLLEVNAAYVGGQGTLQVRSDGVMSVAGVPGIGVSSLSSAHPAQPVGPAGHVVVEPSGRLELPVLGVNLQRGYDIDIQGRMVSTGNGFLALQHDSVVTVESTGTYELGGFGGFYESPPPSGPDTIPSLVNDGTLLKSGSGTAVIAPNANGYVEAVDVVNHIEVTGGTAAFAGGTAYAADVDGGQQLSTARCAVRDPTQPCQEERGSGANSVALAVPGAPANQAVVNVFENAPLDFTAHIDVLPPGGPAAITFRLGRDVVGTTHPADVQIRHDNDAGFIKDCLGSALPPGETNCIDRGASSYDAANRSVVMIVRSIQTSRYVCHKEDITQPTTSATASGRKLNKPVTLTVTSDEAGTVSIDGTAKGTGKKLPLKALTAAVAADQATPISFTLRKLLKPKHWKKVKGAKKVKLALTVTVTDSAGKVSTARELTLKLR